MKIRRYGLLCAAIFASVLSGCGKKEVDDSDQIANDFVSVQGTMTDAPGEKAVDEFSVPISNGVINVKIDVGEIDNRVSRIYPATRLTVDEQYIDSIAAKLFDNGSFEVLETVDGSDEEDTNATNIVTEGTLLGSVNGEQYTLSYSNNIEETETGLADKGFCLWIMKQSENEDDLLFEYGEVSEEECASNVCDHDDALTDAEAFIAGLGFDDYALSDEYPLVDLEIEGERQGCGYKFVFCKEIDGTFGKVYSNDCYYKKDGDGATYFEYINVYVTAENGITGVDIKNMYDIDYSVTNANVVLLGVDEAMMVAKDEITKMLLEADEVGSSLAEKTRLEPSMVLTYVPLQYGDEIAYMPVYLFVVNLYTDSIEQSVLLGVSAVDGETVICNYFYAPEVPFFSPAVG